MALKSLWMPRLNIVQTCWDYHSQCLPFSKKLWKHLSLGCFVIVVWDLAWLKNTTQQVNVKRWKNLPHSVFHKKYRFNKFLKENRMAMLEYCQTYKLWQSHILRSTGIMHLTRNKIHFSSSGYVEEEEKAHLSQISLKELNVIQFACAVRLTLSTGLP